MLARLVRSEILLVLMYILAPLGLSSGPLPAQNIAPEPGIAPEMPPPQSQSSEKHPPGEDARPGSAGLQMLWPTPLFRDLLLDRPDTWSSTQAQELAAAALRLAEKIPSFPAANVDMWHSPRNLHQVEVPEFMHLRDLFERVCATFLRATIDEQAIPGSTANTFARLLQHFGPDRLEVKVVEMWATVARPGDYMNVHTHASSMLSGIFYVHLPPPEVPPASIFFADPRPQTSLQDVDGWMQFGNSLHINPRLGEVFVFPSWLPHGVYRQSGEATPRQLENGTVVKGPQIDAGSIVRIAYNFNANFEVRVDDLEEAAAPPPPPSMEENQAESAGESTEASVGNGGGPTLDASEGTGGTSGGNPTCHRDFGLSGQCAS